MRLRVVTWNVLHRVHAENWEEPCARQFPDEAVRIAGITSRVVGFLAAGVDAVCLQEVSGDQLASLRAALPAGADLFEHQYPRLPRLRRTPCGTTLTDANEHLVTIARTAGAAKVGSRTFDKDPGKGLLVVELAAGIHLVCTHLSYGGRKGVQLAEIAAAAERASVAAIVVGDTNAPAAAVHAALGPAWVVSKLTAVTRVNDGPRGGSIIDHVLVRGGVLEEAGTGDGGGLSDHVPVLATIRLGAG
ncbi:MAG: Endonuclease/exonuclease/phosphatase [Labilithrix sp.]|nr:Endonuclease/exonuclease/phosphatase [Labilithrix sp.]